MGESTRHGESHEAFRARLPHRTVRTNLPGVFATAPLSADFDPNTASEHALVKHGLLLQRPKPGDDGVAARAWKRAFARRWLPEKHVVPEMQVRPGRRHVLRRSVVKESVTAPWSGGVLTGRWSLVSSYWGVPTVSKPHEPAGSDGGWDSSSWIGIDGLGSLDVLQAGVQQSVDGDGNATYQAWFEWFCIFDKATLPDTTPSSFAMASDGSGKLFVAYRGGDDRLNLMVSLNDRLPFPTFGERFVSPESTQQGPALAFHPGGVFVAWTDASRQLNIAGVVEPAVAGGTLGLKDKVPLPWNSARGPALASFANALFLAWKDNDLIHIASLTLSPTEGLNNLAFAEFVSNETSPEAPSLAVHDGKLLIAWKGDGNDFLNVATVNVAMDAAGARATGISDKLIISTERSPLGPSIASVGQTLFLAWRGDGNDFLNVMQSTDGGQSFSGKFISPETSPSAPCIAQDLQQLFIGWRGEDDHINVSAVGVHGGTIDGFSHVPYIDETVITNFSVNPGDEVVCTIFFVPSRTAGCVAFGNVTSGEYFSISLVPPPGAQLAGESIEWILETPLVGGVNAPPAALPAFTPIVFTDALGCGPDGVGNPKDGNSLTLPLTSVTLASDTVTIEFTG